MFVFKVVTTVFIAIAILISAIVVMSAKRGEDREASIGASVFFMPGIIIYVMALIGMWG